jgi:hypothetical protein
LSIDQWRVVYLFHAFYDSLQCMFEVAKSSPIFNARNEYIAHKINDETQDRKKFCFHTLKLLFVLGCQEPPSPRRRCLLTRMRNNVPFERSRTFGARILVEGHIILQAARSVRIKSDVNVYWLYLCLPCSTRIASPTFSLSPQRARNTSWLTISTTSLPFNSNRALSC